MKRIYFSLITEKKSDIRKRITDIKDKTPLFLISQSFSDIRKGTTDIKN